MPHRRHTRSLSAALIALALVATARAQSAFPPVFPPPSDTAAQPAAPEPAPAPADAPLAQAPEQSDPAKTPPPSPSSTVKVSEHLTVDMQLNDESLANVLQMLAIQSQRNIIAGKDINATITASIYGATFFEALDAILHANGYGYIEKGNFIYIYTLEELNQINQAARRPVSRAISLNYLNANDAAQFVTPLLSAVGQIKTNGDVAAFAIQDVPVGDERFALAATLVIFDYPENVDEIEALLRQLDTRPSQVLVEATILESRITENNAFGVDFSAIASLNFSDFLNDGGPLSVFNGIRNPPAGATGDRQGYNVTSSPGLTSEEGTIKIGIIDENIAAFVSMLDKVGDVSIISNPKLLALNRQPARVLVGQRLGYLSTTATETATTQTVEFLDTGTQLAFRPFIANDGMIRMELRPSVSSGTIRTVTGTSGAASSIPDELTNEVTTNVLVRDGSTIVLGGLFKESTTLNRRQVPVLGDIPILGAAFRGHDDAIVRTEIIFLITPTVVSEKLLADHATDADGLVQRIRAGSRTGLLPWSRESMTAKLNVEAQELARAGETDKALWKLSRSLELNPNQPDAIRLREELTGKQDVWPTRSLLEQLVVPANPSSN
ncbi:MAG: type II secretion system protein GspD [Phycisphaerales bacterium]